MRLILSFYFALIINFNFIKFAATLENDSIHFPTEQSPELRKFSLGFTNFQDIQNGVKKIAAKAGAKLNTGFEKFKNLFSKNRTVGDYYLDNINVRSGHDIGNNRLSKSLRDVSDKSSNINVPEGAMSRNPEISTFVPQTCRHGFIIHKGNCRKIVFFGSITTTKSTRIRREADTSESSKSGESNESGGVASAVTTSIFNAPLLCPSGYKLLKKRCRKISREFVEYFL